MMIATIDATRTSAPFAVLANEPRPGACQGHTYQTEAWIEDDHDGRAQLWAAAYVTEHPEIRIAARARHVTPLPPLYLVDETTVQVLREQAAAALLAHLAERARSSRIGRA